MTSSFASLLYFLICLTITIRAVAPSKSAELVDKVCKSASSYIFCIDALYSDPLTQQAGGFQQLADISVRLAYNNATSTQSYIVELLSQEEQVERLERCRDDYAEAVKAIGVAASDVNSEDFYELPDLAANATRAADDCEAAFQGTPSSPPLGNNNQNLKGLCEIFAIVARMLTSG